MSRELADAIANYLEQLPAIRFNDAGRAALDIVAGLTPQQLSIALAGLFLAGLVKGATGIGYSSCALPFLASTLGLRTAMGLVVVPAMASNLALLATAGHLRATVERFWPLYIGMLPGIVAGIAALASTDPHVATRTLGLIVILYGLQALVSPDLRLAPATARSLQVPVGLANGFLTGLTGSQVMPLMPYLLSLKMGPGQFVQANNIAVILASVTLGAGLWISGIVGPGMLALSLGAVIPALVGVQLGGWIRSRIRDAHFRRLVIIVLTVIGATLVTR